MIRLLRFSVNDEDRALFPEAFTFIEHDGETSRTINGKKYGLASVYSMHTDLEAIPQAMRFTAWEWPGWTGRQVTFDEWRKALATNGHAFKYDVKEEVIAATIAATTLQEAVLELWSGGDVEYKKSLAQTATWLDMDDFKDNLRNDSENNARIEES